MPGLPDIPQDLYTDWMLESFDDHVKATQDSVQFQKYTDKINRVIPPAEAWPDPYDQPITQQRSYEPFQQPVPEATDNPPVQPDAPANFMDFAKNHIQDVLGQLAPKAPADASPPVDPYDQSITQPQDINQPAAPPTDPYDVPITKESETPFLDFARNLQGKAVDTAVQGVQGVGRKIGDVWNEVTGPDPTEPTPIPLTDVKQPPSLTNPYTLARLGARVLGLDPKSAQESRDAIDRFHELTLKEGDARYLGSEPLTSEEKAELEALSPHVAQMVGGMGDAEGGHGTPPRAPKAPPPLESHDLSSNYKADKIERIQVQAENEIDKLREAGADTSNAEQHWDDTFNSEKEEGEYAQEFRDRRGDSYKEMLAAMEESRNELNDLNAEGVPSPQVSGKRAPIYMDRPPSEDPEVVKLLGENKAQDVSEYDWHMNHNAPMSASKALDLAERRWAAEVGEAEGKPNEELLRQKATDRLHEAVSIPRPRQVDEKGKIIDARLVHADPEQLKRNVIDWVEAPDLSVPEEQARLPAPDESYTHRDRYEQMIEEHNDPSIGSTQKPINWGETEYQARQKGLKEPHPDDYTADNDPWYQHMHENAVPGEQQVALVWEFPDGTNDYQIADRSEALKGWPEEVKQNQETGEFNNIRIVPTDWDPTTKSYEPNHNTDTLRYAQFTHPEEGSYIPVTKGKSDAFYDANTYKETERPTTVSPDTEAPAAAVPPQEPPKEPPTTTGYPEPEDFRAAADVGTAEEFAGTPRRQMMPPRKEENPYKYFNPARSVATPEQVAYLQGHFGKKVPKTWEETDEMAKQIKPERAREVLGFAGTPGEATAAHKALQDAVMHAGFELSQEAPRIETMSDSEKAAYAVKLLEHARLGAMLTQDVPIVKGAPSEAARLLNAQRRHVKVANARQMADKFAASIEANTQGVPAVGKIAEAVGGNEGAFSEEVAQKAERLMGALAKGAEEDGFYREGGFKAIDDSIDQIEGEGAQDFAEQLVRGGKTGEETLQQLQARAEESRNAIVEDEINRDIMYVRGNVMEEAQKLLEKYIRKEGGTLDDMPEGKIQAAVKQALQRTMKGETKPRGPREMNPEQFSRWQAIMERKLDEITQQGKEFLTKNEVTNWRTAGNQAIADLMKNPSDTKARNALDEMIQHLHEQGPQGRKLIVELTDKLERHVGKSADKFVEQVMARNIKQATKDRMTPFIGRARELLKDMADNPNHTALEGEFQNLLRIMRKEGIPELKEIANHMATINENVRDRAVNRLAEQIRSRNVDALQKRFEQAQKADEQLMQGVTSRNLKQATQDTLTPYIGRARELIDDMKRDPNHPHLEEEFQNLLSKMRNEGTPELKTAADRMSNLNENARDLYVDKVYKELTKDLETRSRQLSGTEATPAENIANKQRIDDLKTQINDLYKENKKNGTLTDPDYIKQSSKLLEELKTITVNEKNVGSRAAQGFVGKEHTALKAERIREMVSTIRKGIDAARNGTHDPTLVKELQDMMGELHHFSTNGQKKYDQLNTALKRSGLIKYIGKQDDPEIIRKLTDRFKNIDPNDPKAIVEFAKEARSPRFIDYLMEFGVMNMLSHPQTWGFFGVNTQSNIAQTLTHVYGDRFLREKYDAIRSKLTGKERAIFDGEQKAARDALWSASGAGWKQAMEVLQHGYLRSDLTRATQFGDLHHVPREYISEAFDKAFQKMNLPTPLRKLGNLGVAMHEVSTRPLRAMDVMFGQMIYSSELAAQVYRKSEKTGTSVADILADPLKHRDVVEASGKIENALLLKSKGVAAWTLKNTIEKMPRNSPLRQALEMTVYQVLPFATVAENYVKQGLRFTPAGMVYSGGKAISSHMRGDYVSSAEHAVNVAKGATILGIGWWLHEQQLLSGSGNFDQQDRNNWEPGKTPYSIKINGTWVSLQGTPLQIPLGSIADTLDIWHMARRKASEEGRPQPTWADVAGDVALGQVKSTAASVYQHPLLRSSEDLGGLATGQVNMDRLINGQIGRYTTNGLLSYMAGLGDAYDRDAKTLGERIELKTPGLRQTLPRRQDTLGRDVPNDMSAAGQSPLQAAANAVLPFPKRSVARDEPILKTFREQNASIPGESKSYLGTPLTKSEAQGVQRTQGQLLTQYQKDIVDALKDYKSPHDRQRVLDIYMNRLRTASYREALSKTDFLDRKEILDKALSNIR